MKTLVPILLSLALCGVAQAATTIDPAHPYAYGANVGWINAAGDETNGAVLGTSYCSGWMWSANCGWIGLGNGPTNGWQYGNAAADDWGVNHDGEGALSGQAWGPNIGWVTFEQTHGQPRIDLRTGNLSGYAWGAAIGWISLSNTEAFVRTGTLAPGPDSDADGIPDAWEYQMAGDLDTLTDGGHDEDGDGVPDVDEYPADTDPTDIGEWFYIQSIASADGTNTLEWTSRPTRLYRVEATNSLVTGGPWEDVGGGLIGPPPVSPSQAQVPVPEGSPVYEFYRVRALVPLEE